MGSGGRGLLNGVSAGGSSSRSRSDAVSGWTWSFLLRRRFPGELPPRHSPFDPRCRPAGGSGDGARPAIRRRSLRTFLRGRRARSPWRAAPFLFQPDPFGYGDQSRRLPLETGAPIRDGDGSPSGSAPAGYARNHAPGVQRRGYRPAEAPLVQKGQLRLQPAVERRPWRAQGSGRETRSALPGGVGTPNRGRGSVEASFRRRGARSRKDLTRLPSPAPGEGPSRLLPQRLGGRLDPGQDPLPAPHEGQGNDDAGEDSAHQLGAPHGPGNLSGHLLEYVQTQADAPDQGGNDPYAES